MLEGVLCHVPISSKPRPTLLCSVLMPGTTTTSCMQPRRSSEPFRPRPRWVTSNHFWYVDSDPLPPLPSQAHKSAKKKAAEAMKEVAAIATVQRARKTYW